MAERLNLTVDDGIGEKLAELAGSRNRMGEMVSNLVRAAREVDQVPATSDTETLRLMVLGLSAELKLMKRKLVAVYDLTTNETIRNHERIVNLMYHLGIDRDVQIELREVSDAAIDQYTRPGMDLFTPDYF